MSNERSTPQGAGGPKLPSWLVIVLVIGFLGITWWQNNLSPKQNPSVAKSVAPSVTDSDQAESDRSRRPKPFSSDASTEISTDNSPFKVQNQSIRDLNGQIVYQGTIDLTPTLARINRGESNKHRNDGTIFQNREQQLPRNPGGYYKEYVHPTPGEHGPGPQRIIIGKEGEIWYTPDHYKTFTQIKSTKE